MNETKSCNEGCSCHGTDKDQLHVIKIHPGQVLKWKGKKPLPNDRCHCGSGKKFKKCCGR